jgi:DNA polymerase IV
MSEHVFPATPRTILHVDINSYFATLLQQENPSLRGKPLGVLKGPGRTCLIAVSKEAKKFGVQTGSRLKDARLYCPHILTLPAEFDRYLDATYRLHRIFQSISPDIYIFSLDEAFIDVTACQPFLYTSPRALAEEIQRRIAAELGEWVTCSVGISHSRLLAKLGSSIAPKGGILEITPENQDAMLASAEFSDVCGVGYRLEQKLKLIGVTSPYHLRMASAAELTTVVGPFWAEELQKIADGRDPLFLQRLDEPANPHMKSVSRSITGYSLCHDENQIRAVLLNLSMEAMSKARHMKLVGRQPSISLSGHDQRWGLHRTLPHPVTNVSEFFDVIYHQLYRSWERSFPIIKFVVRLSLLSPQEHWSLPLSKTWQRHEQLHQAIDQLTERYGLFTVRPGTLLSQPLIRPEVTGFLGDRTYLGLE